MPNTLLFPGSCVVMDVKGDIFEATARHRQAQGDQVIRIAPFDFEHPSHRYNPLERISRIADTDQRFTELSKLASYFLIPKNEKGGASDFIVGARQLFVAGGMLAIRGQITIGQFVAFTAYLTSMTSTMAMLTNQYVRLQMGMSSFARLDDVLTLAPAQHTTAAPASRHRVGRSGTMTHPSPT